MFLIQAETLSVQSTNGKFEHNFFDFITDVMQ